MSQVAYEQPWSVSTEEPPPPTLWDVPCEAWFEWLVLNAPERLLRLLEGGELEPHHLTYAAEIAGDVPTECYPRLVSALTTLLEHPHATVREGALYGLAKVLRPLPHLRAQIERHTDAQHERSPGVRRAARSVLGPEH